MPRAAAPKPKRRKRNAAHASPQPRIVRATREDYEGFRQAERGEFLPLKGEELEQAMESGELPEHAQRWLAKRN